MPSIDLFPKNETIGIFRGFQEGGLEFHADLVLPYQNRFQNIPMHGQFLLVQLETPDEAVLGRITSLASDGKLAFGSGEEFNLRAVRDGRAVPEDLREQYLKYRVNIRVLGVLRNDTTNGLVFAPSHRRLPHVGSPVAFPSSAVLREIAGSNISGAGIGHLALGEYIFSGESKEAATENWMQIREPEISVKFPISNLVSRRSFIFARAGFGKSNLTKLLFSKLYETTPTVPKGENKNVPVGTVIFDPDGEYFWKDDRGRPGLCDVPHLKDHIVVFTQRQAPNPYYGSFVVGGIKLDIRRLPPADVIAIALPPDKQDQQNVGKLRGLSRPKWRDLVDLIDKERNAAPTEAIAKLLNLDKSQEAEAFAARSNMTKIVSSIHDRNSRLIDQLLTALAAGKLCIIDVSQLRGAPAFILSGLILRKIFDHNQEQFTAAEPKTIPTIAVVEEAQSVLDEKASAATPYIEWVKEGRKYDLGALLITQQPGSIPVDILSQGDNWFVFHLLSAADLSNVKRANAHFSDDILSVLLNEPISGQGVFWSSAGGKPYPIPVRILSFEKLYKIPNDKHYQTSVDTYAAKLRSAANIQVEDISEYEEGCESDENTLEVRGNYLDDMDDQAINALWQNKDVQREFLSDKGIPWGKMAGLIEESLPTDMVDRSKYAFQLVRSALDKLGAEDEVWTSFRTGTKNTLFVRAIDPSQFEE